MDDLYSEIKPRVILAAGGNPTGIIQFPDNSRRREYEQIAKYFMLCDSRLEQFGFLEGQSSFYMSGGEFSGNGARAAAWLIFKLTNEKNGKFTMSGLAKPVEYSVLDNGLVRCVFPGMALNSKKVLLADNSVNGTLVDMDGITHFVFDTKTEFRNSPEYYKKIHTEIVKSLGLQDKPAVGVIWQKKMAGGIGIDPIVWVKAINSFFYETACGSGSLAVLAADGNDNLPVIQPSGKTIEASKINGQYSLASEVTEA